MRKHIVLASIAGLASAAAAQSASLSLVFSQTTIDTTFTSSITMSLFADADFGTHITGAAVALNAVGDTDIVTSTELSSVAAWGALGEDDFGDAGDGSHAGMIMGQVTFLPFIQPDAASALGNGPVLLATYTIGIAAGASGIVDWTTAGGIGTFALEVIDVNANPGGNPPGEIIQIAAPDFGSARLVIFPAPSSGALLGLGALVATRRRR